MKVIRPRTKFTCPILLNQIKVTWIVITYTLPVPGCPTGYTGPGVHGPSLRSAFSKILLFNVRSVDPSAQDQVVFITTVLITIVLVVLHRMLINWYWVKRTFTNGQQLERFISQMEVLMFFKIFDDFILG